MAIDPHALLVWLHILLFVFWLGADVGVFLAAAWVKQRGMPFEQRALLLRLAGLIDLSPRLCMAFMAPVGLILARPYGLAPGNGTITLAWAVAAIWAASIVIAYRSEGTPLAARIARTQMALFAIAGIGAVTWGASLLGNPEVPGWLAAKIALFGVIFFLAIAIDLSFRPVIAAFLALAGPDAGPDASDAREALLRTAIDRCLVVVATLYAVLLAASFLGTIKP